MYMAEALYLTIFVYVIGLLAVQFRHNWMKKFLRTAKFNKAVGQVQFGSPRNFCIQLFPK